MNRTAFVFDLDDTLYKEYEFVLSGKRAVAADLAALAGAKTDENEIYRSIRDEKDSFMALSAFIAKHRLNIDYTLERFLDVYRKHTPDISLKPETVSVLEHLRDSGCIMAMITDGRSITQRNKIRALGLERFFDSSLILISEETGAEKTSPRPFDIITRRIGAVSAGHIFYIGDNPKKDFLFPNLHGWTSVMLRDTAGVNIHPQNPLIYPPQNRPRITVDSIEEIKNLCHSI